MSASMAMYPCLFMIISGGAILCTKLVRNKKNRCVSILSYLLLVLLLISAAWTSFLPSNQSIPATTFVAFLALIPLIIEDRPIRMAPVIVTSGVIYIIFSSIFKT